MSHLEDSKETTATTGLMTGSVMLSATTKNTASMDRTAKTQTATWSG